MEERKCAVGGRRMEEDYKSGQFYYYPIQEGNEERERVTKGGRGGEMEESKGAVGGGRMEDG